MLVTDRNYGSVAREVLYRMTRLIDRRVVVRTVISLALVGFLLWRVDLEAAARALRDADYVFVVPALAIFLLGKWLVSLRWRLMLLKFGAVPLGPLFGVLLVSNLANNVLPARIGDLVRVQVPAQRYNISRARLAATVFATESLLDGVAFAGLGLLGLALIDVRGFPTEIFWAMFGLLCGGLIAVVPLSHLKLSEGWTSRGIMPALPDRIRLPVEEAVPHFIDGLAVFKDAKLASQTIGLSFAIWLLEVGMFALFGRAFGITLSMPEWMLVMIGANMISAIPITPSNIGAYEVALTELLKALGVAAGAAGGFAIATHMFNIAWITVTGVAAMLALRLSLSDVFSLRGGGEKPSSWEDESTADEPEAPRRPGWQAR